MVRMIRKPAKSNVGGSLVTSLTRFAYKTGTAITDTSSGMAELYRLLLTISGAEGRNGLDAGGLANIERAVLNSGQPELIFLYRRLLADVDSHGAKRKKDLSILRFPMLSRVRERVAALFANCSTVSHGMTATRRNGRGEYQPSQSEYLS